MTSQVAFQRTLPSFWALTSPIIGKHWNGCTGIHATLSQLGYDQARAGISNAAQRAGRFKRSTASKEVPLSSLVRHQDVRREESGLYPEQAAQMWPKLVAAAQKLNLRLGSPAAAPCGGSCITRNPFEW